MTLLEFCKDFFPGEEIFVEHGETITISTKKLLDLEQKKMDSRQINFEQVKPSDILGHIEPGKWLYYDPRPGACCGCWDGTEQITLSEENTRIMKRFRLVIDPEVSDIDLDARRPYFRMRGRPVTEEQAFDIIRRTDFFFTVRNKMDKYHLKDLVGGTMLCNHLYDLGACAWPHGWVRPDGVIGANDITWKYPTENEFVNSVFPLILAFPYLDLMIGVTDWNEGPDYAWDAYSRDDEVFHREDYPDFEENIVYGIWLHDGTLELMAPARARETYAEYRRLYGGPNEAVFKRPYYADNHIFPADFEYLKRCIRSHGLDPEEVLALYEWDPAEGLRYLRTAESGLPAKPNLIKISNRPDCTRGSLVCSVFANIKKVAKST